MTEFVTSSVAAAGEVTFLLTLMNLNEPSETSMRPIRIYRMNIGKLP
jgi:hypothetical protein